MRTMKAILSLIVATLLLLASLPVWAAPRSAGNASTAIGAKPGEILVHFKVGTPPNVRAPIHRAIGGSEVSEIPQIGVVVVKVPEGQEAAFIAQYRKAANVLYAEPNHIFTAVLTPSDPYYAGYYTASHTDNDVISPTQLNQWGLTKVNAPGA